jgi:enamine deaminase RidA (YjgF/YER057c/UK114 family)
MHPGDVYAQTQYILEKIEKVLTDAGFNLSDVVRTRVFVTNIDQWQEVSRAHHEFFAGINPASTMVEVSRLIDNRLLVEIEIDAIKN